MRELKLSGNNNLVALVDDADFEALSAFRWYPAIKSNRGGDVRIYAYRNEYFERTTGRNYRAEKIFLHREVFGAIDSKVLIDHRDRNGLNCQRCNLRIASRSGLNGANSLSRGGTSKYKGVCLKIDKHDNGRLVYKNWVAQITVNRKTKMLGRFRYNARKVNDGERTLQALKATGGKRLMLRDSIGKQQVQ